MARKLKPQMVEKYRHHKGVSVEIFLDRNDHQFFGDFLGTTYKRPSLAEVRQELNRAIEAGAVLDWQPMISVSRLRPFACDDDRSFIGFKISRSWIAKTMDGNWKRARWPAADVDGRDMRVELADSFWARNFHGLPYRGEGHDGSDLLLPYSDALWVALEEIIEKIALLREHLDLLLMTDEGLKQLEAIGGQLALPAFGSSEERDEVETVTKENSDGK